MGVALQALGSVLTSRAPSRNSGKISGVAASADDAILFLNESWLKIEPMKLLQQIQSILTMT